MRATPTDLYRGATTTQENQHVQEGHRISRPVGRPPHGGRRHRWARLVRLVLTGGLVNITVTDVLTDNQVNVQVPIGVAANVCGINANVLATQAISQPIDCDSATTQDLPVRFRR